MRAMAPAGSQFQESSRSSAFVWTSPAPGLWHRCNPQIGRPPVLADLRNHAPCMKATSPLVVGAATAAAAAILLSVPNVTSAYGLNSAGRLEKCRGDEACISTSSVSNPSKFGPPWTFEPQTSSPEEAWNALKVAVENNTDHGRIVESVNGPTNFYLRAEFPSFPKGIDDVEFRMIPNEALVTYRSASRDSLFIYPLQTPIDVGKNQKRLNQIRLDLGWSELDGDIKSASSTDPSPSPDFLPDFE